MVGFCNTGLEKKLQPIINYEVVFIMQNNQFELEFENKRLEQTISLAQNQLSRAKCGNENNKSAIISSKQELRESATHSISGLWSSQGFHDLVELSQYANPVINKITAYEDEATKIVMLERLINSPYFARINFKFEDEDTFEKIYLGRSSLMSDSHETYVYDWRAPIASVFYRFGAGQAFYEAPDGKITGEVNLKRQYEIDKGALEYFFDADVQIVDEFLRKLLSQNTSSKMKTIVETIQREQDIVIRDMKNDLMMVQGVAGSGKTSIALHRAAYLMYQGLSSKLSANNIIVISPNSLFEQYISNVLPELGENNVVSVVFEEILITILQTEHIQTKNQFLEHLITSSNPDYRDIIKSSIKFKTSSQFLEILNRFIYDLPRRVDFRDVFYDGKQIANRQIIKAKILSGRKETPLSLRLKQLEYSILESVHELRENRINKLKDFVVKNVKHPFEIDEYARLLSIYESTALIKEIRRFTEFNLEDFYKRLFSDKKYFYSLAEDIDLPDCIEEILNFTIDNLKTDTLYYDDAIVLTFLKLKVNGANDFKNIKQVVIDEAQDYYPLQYEILNLLFSKSKYTILGDINQTLEKQEDLSLYEQIGEILKKEKSILITMDKSFRCTNEILSYSSKFIEKNSEIKSFNRKGDEPKIFAATNQIYLNDMIISEVMTCLEKGYRSIGLICKTEKNALSLFEGLKGRVDVRLIKIDSTADLNGTFIIPVYMSKGLEFDAVLICDTDHENYHSEDDKKLLYIACTRALHRLSLFCNGEISRLL